MTGFTLEELIHWENKQRNLSSILVKNHSLSYVELPNVVTKEAKSILNVMHMNPNTEDSIHLSEFIEELYYKRFKRERPENNKNEK